jgi:hypothetical protein
MSERLQVLLDAAELAEIRRAARQRRMTTSEWVRQALREARRQVPKGDPKRKLEVVRVAARHRYPTGDVGEMLADIERGYAAGAPAP